MKSYVALSVLVLASQICWAESIDPKAKHEIPQVTDSLARICEKPRSPLYKAESNFDRLHVELITDFEGLNLGTNSNVFPGVIKVLRQEKATEFYPVLISQRGNSRREYCSARPFRMQFLKPELKQKIEQSLSAKEIKAENALYMKNYYDELISESPTTENVVSLKSGIFKNLGDDVKFVTHCGTSGWNMVGGETDEVQNQKLFSEYTLYKILDTLHLPIEATRLAAIVYYKKDGTAVYADEKGLALEKQGFFREPPKSTADRCGLLSHLDPNQNIHDQSSDAASEVQTTLINNFVFNNDYGTYGHNMNRYYDISGKVVLGPYDFDLSGIVVDNYFKNVGSIEDQFANVMNYVKSSDPLAVKATLQRIINAKAEMKAAVASSEINDDTKAKFNKWLDLYIGNFETYLAENK